MVFGSYSGGHECPAGGCSERRKEVKDARSEAERIFRFWATMVFGATMMLGGCVVAINTGEPREDEKAYVEETRVDAREISGEAA